MNHSSLSELVVDDRPIGLTVGRQGVTPGRPNFLFVHGSGGSNLVWTGLLSRLSRNFNALAVELPGHGHTPEPLLADIPSAGEWLIRVINSLALDSSPILVGASLGGAIVLEAAIHHNDQISGLILISTAARLSVDPAFLTLLNEDYITGLTEFGAKLFVSGTPDLVVNRSLEALAHAPSHVLLHDLAMSKGFDRRGLLAKIEAPVLVLCGDGDVLTPPNLARELASGFPCGRLMIIPKAGHMVVIEQPLVVARAIENFASEMFN